VLGIGFRSNREERSLQLFWLRDWSLEEFDSVAALQVIAQEIVDDLATAFEPLREIATEVSSGSTPLGLGWRVDHDDDRLALS